MIQPNYLSADLDRRVLVSAMRCARRILATPELAPYYDAEVLPGAQFQSDDELLAFAREYGTSSYHYTSTCRMGPAGDKYAVVDPSLRVHGIAGLRVVDASVMPAVTSGNTYAPTLMIAAKAADMITGRPAPLALDETSNA